MQYLLYVISEPSNRYLKSIVYLLPPISFDNGKTFQGLGLEIWGEPSKATEMFQSGSSLLAEDGVGPVLMLTGLSRGNGRRSHQDSQIKIL